MSIIEHKFRTISRWNELGIFQAALYSETMRRLISLTCTVYCIMDVVLSWGRKCSLQSVGYRDEVQLTGRLTVDLSDLIE